MRWKDFSIRGRTLSPPRNEVNIVLEKFTLQPRAPFFNHFRSQTAKIIPHLLCLRRRHLSELMAYFGALTLSTPRSETAIYQISPAASHTYIPTHLYTLLPILAASHRLELLIFFSLLVGALEELPRKCNSDELKFFLFPYNVCHIISFCCHFMHRFRRYYNQDIKMHTKHTQ